MSYGQPVNRKLLRVEIVRWEKNTKTNIWQSFELLKLAVKMSVYDRGTVLANRLASLLPCGDITYAPIYLKVFYYPAGYTEALNCYANEFELDPCLIAALIKQESWWNRFAESPVGARGMMQIMPSTGKYLAEKLGETDYQRNWLNVPDHSLRYGAFYLARQMDTYESCIPLVLASYNAGPGNTKYWDTGNCSPAEIVERITLDETKNYVRKVFEYYSHYCELYVEVDAQY
jgi:soluble lytic murein transglycosylase